MDAGELEQAYALLSPGFQADQDVDSYEDFWEGIASIDVVGRPEVDVDTLTAVARLRYVRTDGTRTDETNSLTLVTDDDGRLLIDSDSSSAEDG